MLINEFVEYVYPYARLGQDTRYWIIDTGYRIFGKQPLTPIKKVETQRYMSVISLFIDTIGR
jgi:hypothetical protein